LYCISALHSLHCADVGDVMSLIAAMCSAALRESLEQQRKSADEQLTAERARMQRQLDASRDDKKDAETRLENQRCTASEQLDRQRQRTRHVFLRATAATAVARLSHRNSVRLSVSRVDQSKTVQATITKFSPSTLVSGTVKLFHKLEEGHPERGR